MFSMISDYGEKIKSWVQANKPDLFMAGVIFLVGLGSFGLGRLSVLWPEKQAIEITGTKVETGIAPSGSADTPAAAAGLAAKAKATSAAGEEIGGKGSGARSQQPATSAAGRYVGSKSGSSYHLPWCPGAKQIKESNKIWFETRAEAESKGYKPAANCPGL